jgi:hypothetical protein
MDDDKHSPSPAEAIKLMVGNEWEEKHERPRGIFTDTDRRFLWGLKNYKNEETSINRRKEIRNRASNGIQDLFYLSMLEQRDRKRVFEQLEEETEPGALHSAISTLIEFVYLGIGNDKDQLEEMISLGVNRAEDTSDASGLYQGGVKEVTVDIDIDYEYDAEAIYQRFQEGEGYRLTPAEIGVLVKQGMLGAEDLDEMRYDLFPEKTSTEEDR